MIEYKYNIVLRLYMFLWIHIQLRIFNSYYVYVASYYVWNAWAAVSSNDTDRHSV